MFSNRHFSGFLILSWLCWILLLMLSIIVIIQYWLWKHLICCTATLIISFNFLRIRRHLNQQWAVSSDTFIAIWHLIIEPIFLFYLLNRQITIGLQIHRTHFSLFKIVLNLALQDIVLWGINRLSQISPFINWNNFIWVEQFFAKLYPRGRLGFLSSFCTCLHIFLILHLIIILVQFLLDLSIAF